MPLYRYEIINEDGSSGEELELFQRMDEAPLTQHPETGAPIRRLFSVPNVSGKWSDSAIKSDLSNTKKLEHLGFTKYERVGKNKMERRAGHQGPKTISAD